MYLPLAHAMPGDFHLNRAPIDVKRHPLNVALAISPALLLMVACDEVKSKDMGENIK